ncbi:PoNe immunity protein domain-containing protein [Neisseria leonii]
MHLRDNLSSLTNYDKIIKFNKKAIHEFKKEIIELQHDDSKGIQRYPNSNFIL